MKIKLEVEVELRDWMKANGRSPVGVPVSHGVPET